MKLKLPYPVSANRYWRHHRTRAGELIVHVSDEAKVYKEQVGWLARAAGLRAVIPGLLELRITLHPRKPKTLRFSNDEVRCMDLDNALKVAVDAMQGIAYPDDKAIRRMVVERGEPVEEGGLTVEIMRYEQRLAA